jgi:hypothetical protein
VALALNPKPWAIGSAAKAVLLPKTKPRTMREFFVVPSIRRREVTRVQWPRIGRRVDILKALDFGNRLLDVHYVPISNIGMAVVNRTNSNFRA